MDREGQDAFDLLDEIESKLKIKVRPMSWPIGIGATFKGVYHMQKDELNLFDGNKTNIEKNVIKNDCLFVKNCKIWKLENLGKNELEEYPSTDVALSLNFPNDYEYKDFIIDFIIHRSY